VKASPEKKTPLLAGRKFFLLSFGPFPPRFGRVLARVFFSRQKNLFYSALRVPPGPHGNRFFSFLRWKKPSTTCLRKNTFSVFPLWMVLGFLFSPHIYSCQPLETQISHFACLCVFFPPGASSPSHCVGFTFFYRGTVLSFFFSLVRASSSPPHKRRRPIPPSFSPAGSSNS